MNSEPKHGDERNRHMARETSVFQGVAGEQTVSIPYTSREYTYSERYCGTCKAWIECKGIIDHMLCRTCKNGW